MGGFRYPSWTRAVREFALPVRLVGLLIMLVLLGCSSSPCGFAARIMSSGPLEALLELSVASPPPPKTHTQRALSCGTEGISSSGDPGPLRTARGAKSGPVDGLDRSGGPCHEQHRDVGGLGTQDFDVLCILSASGGTLVATA